MEFTAIYALWLLITIPTVLVQLVLARHAMRAGSIPWAVFILVAPVLGGALYYFSVYRPALHARRLEESAAAE
jgi:hypothetical protein